MCCVRPQNGMIDVLVAGGGNAALCAAIEARRQGANVLVVECAARAWRGGNSKYTRNVRCVHDDGDEVMPGAYDEDEFERDLRAVTGGGPDERLVRLMIDRSRALPAWMSQQGVAWQPAYSGTLQLGRTNRFFLGGGKALLNTYYATAEALGIRIAYDTFVERPRFHNGRCVSVTLRHDGRTEEVAPRAVVVATGGFEANTEWMAEYWGDAASNFIIRGSRHNDGALLRELLDCGATACGNPRGFHAIAVDARAPHYDGGIVTRIDAIPFGIVVNRDAQRFYDEGEDLWPKRYATWGKRIAGEGGQEAYAIFDSRVRGRFIESAYPPASAETIDGLAETLGLDASRLRETVDRYSASIMGADDFDPSRLDGAHTVGISPPKSHWALPIDRPPFYAYPMRPGITFTYLGVEVDERARVVRDEGAPFENVYAAGEIMAGNILRQGYLAGAGMTIGTVFGLLAGEGAASHAG